MSERPAMARPRTQLLTSQKIHRAALELFDEQNNFSIPRLAQRLGVSPSSLYHHVSGGRTDIIKGIRALISQEAYSRGDFPPQGVTWQGQVRQWAINYRDAMGRHPMAIPALVGEPVDDTDTLNIYENLVQILETAGFQDELLLQALSLIDVLALGSAVDAASPEPPWKASHSVRPALSRALTSGHTGRRQDDAFNLGLDATIDKLEQMLVSPSEEMFTSKPAL
ncbi:TetR/AcrR family transcriptional regulator [Arthrobacter castelli]|uniref:TetR/AcrR family transcriptional regulator n=1 Tax=Arthrobacter castelli TaxID=271431 RepID=UPI0009D79849|nr:TetR/AcrR family transcriptional regulator C-terminal domain-containing protein [Arthrobacter castelli]